jgi:hypothetical protein
MYDLERFTIQDMIHCGDQLRAASPGARSMEEVGQGMVTFLHREFRDPSGRPSLALARLYKTLPYDALGAELRSFADGSLRDEPHTEKTKCLTLLATAGDVANWNSRAASAGHRAIPLPSADVVERLPMVAQLIRQLGIEVSSLVSADRSLIVDVDQRTYNVFYVGSALGSPFIPAQTEFVKPHGIRSVVGFGGMLPSGELYAFILFSKVFIAEDTAQMFRTLALKAKLALLPFSRGPIFST